MADWQTTLTAVEQAEDRLALALEEIPDVAPDPRTATQLHSALARISAQAGELKRIVGTAEHGG